MATPSLVSDAPCGDTSSSSNIAKSHPLFGVWMFRAKVDWDEDPPVEVNAHFDMLYKLEELPCGLTQDSLPTPIHDNEADFQRIICQWASTLPRTEKDEHGLLRELPHLALAYSRIRKTLNLYSHSKEHARHRGVDDIIEMAFSARVDRHCDFGTEESYRLVASDGHPDAQSDSLEKV